MHVIFHVGSSLVTARSTNVFLRFLTRRFLVLLTFISLYREGLYSLHVVFGLCSDRYSLNTVSFNDFQSSVRVVSWGSSFPRSCVPSSRGAVWSTSWYSMISGGSRGTPVVDGTIGCSHCAPRAGWVRQCLRSA